jgi:SAM-dependent methyltransferase
LHRDLPREGPGDDGSTERALRLTGILNGDRTNARGVDVLDIGCGPGAQTIVLARETGGSVVALDVHEPFLAVVRRRAAGAALADRIRTVHASMTALPFAHASFDLIWSEGAIFVMGFEPGLRAWRPLLRERGALVVSELSWLAADPPAAARAFWEAAYPGMASRDANRATIERCGYTLVDDFVLPRSSWFTEYFDPLERRIDALTERHARDPAALVQLAAEREEIDVVRRYGDAFGYVFFVMRKAAP